MKKTQFLPARRYASIFSSSTSADNTLSLSSVTMAWPNWNRGDKGDNKGKDPSDTVPNDGDEDAGDMPTPYKARDSPWKATGLRGENRACNEDKRKHAFEDSASTKRSEKVMKVFAHQIPSHGFIIAFRKCPRYSLQAAHQGGTK